MYTFLHFFFKFILINWHRSMKKKCIIHILFEIHIINRTMQWGLDFHWPLLRFSISLTCYNIILINVQYRLVRRKEFKNLCGYNG